MASIRVQSKSIPLKKLKKRAKRSSYPYPAKRNRPASGPNPSASPAEPINTLASQSSNSVPTASNAQTLSSAAPDAPRTPTTNGPHPPVSARQSRKDLPKWNRSVTRLMLAIVTAIGVIATIIFGIHLDGHDHELTKQIKWFTNSYFTESCRYDQVC